MSNKDFNPDDYMSNDEMKTSVREPTTSAEVEPETTLKDDNTEKNKNETTDRKSVV